MPDLVPGGAERFEKILVEAPDVAPLPIAARIRLVSLGKIVRSPRAAAEECQGAGERRGPRAMHAEDEDLHPFRTLPPDVY